MLPRVFDLFTQVDRSLDRPQGGLGIGLTLVRSLVEMHGGRVEARSAGPGQGSEFVVRLPALQEDTARRIGPAASGHQLAAPPRRVLVVDDNADAAESLALLLRLKGHEVRRRYDGATALEVRSRPPSPTLYCSTWACPAWTGYDVARRLRRQKSLNDVLLVALTG